MGFYLLNDSNLFQHKCPPYCCSGINQFYLIYSSFRLLIKNETAELLHIHQLFQNHLAFSIGYPEQHIVGRSVGYITFPIYRYTHNIGQRPRFSLQNSNLRRDNSAICIQRQEKDDKDKKCFFHVSIY